MLKGSQRVTEKPVVLLIHVISAHAEALSRTLANSHLKHVAALARHNHQKWGSTVESSTRKIKKGYGKLLYINVYKSI